MKKRVMGQVRNVWERSRESLRPVLTDVVIFVGVWVLIATIKWGPERTAAFDIPRAPFYPTATAVLGVATLYLTASAKWLPKQAPEERPAQILHSICIVTPVIFLMITTWMTISWAGSFAAFARQTILSVVIYTALVIYSRAVVDAEYEERLRKAVEQRDDRRRLRRSARVWRIVNRQIKVHDDEVASPTVVPLKVRLLGALGYVIAIVSIIVAGAVAGRIASHVGVPALRPYFASFSYGVLAAAFLIIVIYFGRIAWGGIDVVSNGLLSLMYSMIYLVYMLQLLAVTPAPGVGPVLTCLITSLVTGLLVERTNVRVFRDGAPDPNWYMFPLAAGWSTVTSRHLRVRQQPPEEDAT